MRSRTGAPKRRANWLAALSWAGLLTVFVLFLVAIVYETTIRSYLEQNDTSGRAGVLGGPTGGSVLLAESLELFDRFATLRASKAESSIATMIVAGQLLIVDGDTECRIIEDGETRSRVKVLVGPYAGKVGYVFNEALAGPRPSGAPG